MSARMDRTIHITDIAAAWDGLGEASYIRQIPSEAIAFIPFLLWRRLGLVDAILQYKI